MSSRFRSEKEEITLEEIKAKLEEKGVRIWGVDEEGNPVLVRVTSDGKLVCELG